MASDVVSDIRLRLLELDQSTAKILGVQEQHRFAVGADLRLPIAQNPRSARLEALARGEDVVDLVAQMVDAAVGIALQEFFERRSGSQRFEQLDLGIGQADEDRRDAVLGLRNHFGHAGAQDVPIDFGGLGDIAYCNGHVVEASDHSQSSPQNSAGGVPAYTVKTWTWHIGFLSQCAASVLRTARPSDCARASGSRRCGRGNDLNVSMRAAWASSAIGSPSPLRSGIPVSRNSGAAASSPCAVTTSATEITPAKASRRRSGTVRASASTSTRPSL